MREEILGESLASILDGIYIPQKAIQQIVQAQEDVARRAVEEQERETVRLGRSLQEVRRKKQQTYKDKLNGPSQRSSGENCTRVGQKKNRFLRIE